MYEDPGSSQPQGEWEYQGSYDEQDGDGEFDGADQEEGEDEEEDEFDEQVLSLTRRPYLIAKPNHSDLAAALREEMKVVSEISHVTVQMELTPGRGRTMRAQVTRTICLEKTKMRRALGPAMTKKMTKPPRRRPRSNNTPARSRSWRRQSRKRRVHSPVETPSCS